MTLQIFAASNKGAWLQLATVWRQAAGGNWSGDTTALWLFLKNADAKYENRQWQVFLDVVVLLNFETSVVLAKSNRLAFLVIELKMKY